MWKMKKQEHTDFDQITSILSLECMLLITEKQKFNANQLMQQLSSKAVKSPLQAA